MLRHVTRKGVFGAYVSNSVAIKVQNYFTHTQEKFTKEILRYRYQVELLLKERLSFQSE